MLRNRVFCGLLLSLPACLLANDFSRNQFYLGIGTGILNATFNAQYNDLSDTIPQNTAASVIRSSLLGSIAFGWNYYFTNNYFVGLELSENLLSGGAANYNSGANTNVFTDQTTLRNYADLAVRLGSHLTNTLLAYTKLGASYAEMKDYLSSPVGYTPIFTNYTSHQSTTGIVFGLGLQQNLNTAFAVFAEYDYHNYGKVTFQNYTNYTADYSHTFDLSTSAVLVGLRYQF